MQKTLVILKPDAISKGIMGNIITRLENVGLSMVVARFEKVNPDTVSKHYPTDRIEWVKTLGVRTAEGYAEQGLDLMQDFGTSDQYEIGKKVCSRLVEYLTSAPVMVMVREGTNAIEIVRKLIGSTIPSKANPGTIRGDFSIDSTDIANYEKRPIHNLIHASGNIEEADFEVKLRFPELQ